MTIYSATKKARLLALIIGMSNALALAAFAQSYVARKDFATAHDPISIVTADFAGEGKKDVAVLSRSASASDPKGLLTIMFGDGAGNFATRGTPYPTGKGSSQLIVADFNRDGRPDVALTNEDDNNVMIFINAGQGRFNPPITVAVGNKPVGLVARDFDGDQILDLAVANSAANTISILKGNGSGGFSLLRTLSFPQLNQPRGLAAGDLGSGTMDLAVANFGTSNPGTVSILLNDGAANFTYGTTLNANNSPRAVAVADFNNDNLPDVAVTNFFSNNISRFLARPDGTFTPKADTNVGTTPGEITAIDVDGDRNIDLVVANRASNNVTVLFGNGQGAFPTARTLPTGTQPMSVAIEDYNRDGRLDLAVANFKFDSMSVILGAPNRGFNVAPTTTVGGQPTALAILDIDDDGILDVVTVNNGNISRLFGQGDGTFGNNPPGYVPNPPTDPPYARDLNPFGGSQGPRAMVTGDFNRSGKVHFGTSNSQSNNFTRIIRGDQIPTGGGGFAGNNIGGFNGRPVSIATGDFNGDNQPDVATANFDNGSIYYSINDGSSGGFAPPKQVNNVGINPSAIASADLNGDGLSDLVVTSWLTTMGLPAVSIYLVQDYDPEAGGLTFYPPITYSLPRNSFPYGIAIADFNGDNTPDIAIVNQGLNNVNIFLTSVNPDGTVTLSGPTEFPTGGLGPKALLARDIDGDNKPDLVVVNSLTNNISILLGNGDGTFKDPFGSTFGVGPNPLNVAAEDLTGTGTGKLDLIVVNRDGNSISVLINNQ